MKLSIIIPSWNTRDLLVDCLTSVYAHPPQCEFEVWVVDNASSDDSVAVTREKFPQVRLIENQENVGFAGANNQAIRKCNSQYVLLLNSDTKVKPGALQALLTFMDTHSDAGAAGSLLRNADGSLQTSSYPKPTLFREFWRLFHLDTLYPYGRYNMRQWDTAKPRQVDVLMGASLILRREVLEKIGLMDESYFMYSEEVDLCFRLQRAGWRLYWVPSSEVIHYGGQSTQLVALEMFITLYQSKLQFFHKHYGRFAAQLYKFVLVAAAMVRLAAAPVAWLERRAPRRQRYLQTAQNYRHLLATLLGM